MLFVNRGVLLIQVFNISYQILLGAGAYDNVVNQLLSMIDGVKSLNNILVIGMTNRKDLIDEAVLRPGRLEVHIEVGLPDEIGR